MIRVIPCLDVKDGRVVFGNDADRERLRKSAMTATPAKVKAKGKTK